MARQTQSVQAAAGPYPTLPLSAGAATITGLAADATNKEQALFGSYGELMVIAQNTGVGARTVTFTSVVDPYKRTGDITTYSIAAGGIAVFRFRKEGWRQTDGYLYFEASHAEVIFRVLGL